MKQKIIRFIEIVFGYGIVITLFAGGFSALGYIMALFVGGDGAAAICEFIYKKMYPVLVYTSTSLILLGMIKMYIAKDAAFEIKKENKQKS